MNGLDRDDVLRMAREVADKDKVDPVHNDMVTLTVDELVRLLAAEREACAKVAEDTGNISGNMNKTWRNGCFDAAFAIRARGKNAA